MCALSTFGPSWLQRRVNETIAHRNIYGWEPMSCLNAWVSGEGFKFSKPCGRPSAFVVDRPAFSLSRPAVAYCPGWWPSSDNNDSDSDAV